jgi:hypothetical protein
MWKPSITDRRGIFSLHPSPLLLNKQTSNYKEKQAVPTPSNCMIEVFGSCIHTIMAYRTIRGKFLFVLFLKEIFARSVQVNNLFVTAVLRRTTINTATLDLLVQQYEDIRIYIPLHFSRRRLQSSSLWTAKPISVN